MYHPIMFHILYSTYDYASIFRFVTFIWTKHDNPDGLLVITALKFLT